MAWKGTGSFIPAAVRRAVRERDGDQCQLGYLGCLGIYQEMDHIVNVASRGIDRREANSVDELQCVCRPCHRQKTIREAAAGRAAARARALHKVERHPGLRW